jgi:hypothetical protein
MASTFAFVSLAQVALVPVWWGLGGVFVAATSYYRFATKDENRPTTTFERFWLAATGFAAFQLLLFVILALSPQLLADPYSKWFQVLPAPLAAGLALGGIGVHAYKRNKAIRIWESQAYKACQTLGGIPKYVKRLGQYLHALIDSGQQPPENPYSDVMESVAGSTARELEAQFDAQDELRHKWLTMWAAVAHLTKWRTEPRVGMTSFNDRFEEFHTRLTRLLSSIGKPAAKSAGTAVAAEEHSNVADKLVAATAEASNLWAQAIVLSFRTPRNRWRALRQLGMPAKPNSDDEREQDVMLKINALVLAFFVALLIMLIPYLLIGVQGDRSFGQTVWLVIMIGIIYSTSVAAAISTAHLKLRVTRAAVASVVAGLGASIAAIVIQAVAFRSIVLSWHRFEVRWPWMLIASATAAVLALQMDCKWKRVSWLWNGLIQGVFMAIFSLAACRMLYFLGDHKTLSEWAIRVGQCAIIGFALGALVPSQFQAQATNAPVAGNILPKPIQESLERTFRRTRTGLPWWEGD